MASPPKKKNTADRNAPWLGVHVITEFMFCPRAGLIAYELGQEDDDEYYEEQRPDLQYLPCYDLSQIESRLDWIADEIKKQLLKWLWISLGAVLLLAVISIKYSFGFKAFLVLATGLLIFRLVQLFSGLAPLQEKLQILKMRRAAALNAKPTAPAEDTDNEEVNWWNLLEAGFDSVSYREPLRDPNFRVAGRPWRVLKKGSLRIPVWRMRKGTITGGKLKGQHYARMAAYCHLIQQSEGARSPYGIVLLGEDSYQGITVSDGRGSRAAFHKGLRLARSVVTAAQCGNEPSSPEPQKCWNCPNGKPFVYAPGVSNARTGRLNSPVNAHFSGIDRRYYHSECGDRFCWLPPHQKASDKYLN